MRGGLTRAAGVVNGREAIVIEHIIRMARDVAPDWLTSEFDATYRVDIEGEPDIHCAMNLGDAEGHGAGRAAMAATAMRVVNAIPYVIDAPTGLSELARHAEHVAAARIRLTGRWADNRESVFAAVANERRQIATLIDGLDDAQLATDSLCAGWDVKTVAAHLVSVFADSFWVFQWTALRHGGIHRAIDELARRRAQLPAAQIAADLRQGADRELSPPITGPLSGLTDVLVHGGDIRIPLHLPFSPCLERANTRA